MLTGELPLGRFPPPSRKVQIEVRLDDVVLRTLEKEPDLRYQNAGQLKTDIQDISSPSYPARWTGTNYRSETTIFGLPLLHVATGIDPVTGKKRVAKGVIAIGDVALGGIAVGGVAIGGMAIGAVAIGGGAIGYYALGGGAYAIHGYGGNVRDPIAQEFSNGIYSFWRLNWHVALLWLSILTMFPIAAVIAFAMIRGLQPQRDLYARRATRETGISGFVILIVALLIVALTLIAVLGLLYISLRKIALTPSPPG